MKKNLVTYLVTQVQNQILENNKGLRNEPQALDFVWLPNPDSNQGQGG